MARRNDDRPGVAFVLVRFPKVTETFVLREMLQLEKMGVRIEVFSLLPPQPGVVVHPEAEALMKRTHYAPSFFSPKMWKEALGAVGRDPLGLSRLAGRMVLDAAASPALLAKTLFILPKCLYFGVLARKLGLRHIHSAFASHSAACALAASRVSGLPYSMSSDQYDLSVETALHPLKLAATRFLRLISRFNMDLVKKRFGRGPLPPMHIVLRGVDTARYTPSGEVMRGEVMRLLCVASLEERKGHLHLLEALSMLRSQGRKAVLVLVGRGPFEGRIRKRISQLGLEDAVELAGGKTQAQVLDLLHRSDAMVLASVVTPEGRTEGIPNSLMEAMACRLPVVSTRISGIPELIEDGVNGLLAPQRDAVALAAALAALQDDPDRAVEMGRRGRRTVVERFDIVKNTATLWELIREAAPGLGREAGCERDGTG